MSAEVTEQITIDAPPSAVYAVVSDVQRMARYSPECYAILVMSRRGGVPDKFVGFNRNGPLVWFTTCQVLTAKPGEEFTFEVRTLGQPVSQWSYKLAAAGDGTEVTEHWLDQRSPGASRLGRIFTGKIANERPAINREGMRTTLERLKRELEAAS
jgi:uncharacterized protein YndB with AHSA1/START domain